MAQPCDCKVLNYLNLLFIELEDASDEFLVVFMSKLADFNLALPLILFEIVP